MSKFRGGFILILVVINWLFKINPEKKNQTCFQTCFRLCSSTSHQINNIKMSTFSDYTSLKPSKQENDKETRTWTIAKLLGVALGIGAVLILFTGSLQRSSSTAKSFQPTCMSRFFKFGTRALFSFWWQKQKNFTCSVIFVTANFVAVQKDDEQIQGQEFASMQGVEFSSGLWTSKPFRVCVFWNLSFCNRM